MADKQNDKKRSLTCPECMNDIELDESKDYQVGDIIECNTCGSELEVVSVSEDGEIQIEIVEEEK